MLIRTVPPEAVAPDQKLDILQAQSFTLDNGIPFHLLLSGPQPLIRLELIFEAGTWYEKNHNASYFCTKLLSSGTPLHTAEQIENKIAFYGSFIDLESSPDKVTITLYSLAKYLPDLLPLIMEMINECSFPEEEFENFRKITGQNLKINNNKTSYLASIAFKQKIYGNQHPYGRSLTDDSINTLKREDVISFFRNNFNYKNCHIIISGNGNLDFFKLINEHFGAAPWGNYQPTPPAHFVASSLTGSFPIKKEGSLQSSIRIGRDLFTVTHEDYLKTYFLVEVLGGYFGSRLMKNIREEKGFTYGIQSNIITYKHTGYLVIGTDVDKENTGETIQEIYKEMELLKNDPIPHEELETVKNYLLGTFFNSMTTPFALADKFKTVYFHGIDYSFYENYLQTIRTIQSKELLEIANLYFIKDKMVEVAAG